ncbi:SIS domain-containing protein [Butyrivibrio sp. INlla16]|uniref:D-sedoheptulose-7-phosphate isomerase n=1 Tax=Butyrivibrio sp. INlla16 TaxID=1520807 RepID=UPI00088F884E|nr:SIS domain-containing protein [Butyrivibrio sp. INlla16]SDB60193.1 D-sedoheptulose 7-phosphate isomerase [Butyrivibrio sp. INlla16]
MNIKDYNEYLKEVIRLLESVVITEKGQELSYSDGIERIINALSATRQAHRQLFFAGNGGSAAIAGHMTADYLKNAHMRTVSLYDSPVLTCLGNDYGYEYVFSKQLDMMAERGDLLIAISSSGNSQNIVNAIEIVKGLKGTVITFTGFEKTNRVRGMGDINVYVPCSSFGKVESIHQLIMQQVVDEMMEREED